MKKIISLISSPALILSLILFTGCGKKIGSGVYSGKTLNLYVAAGMKKPMDQAIQLFEKETGAVVAVNYGPSGGLYAQIKQDQPCDLYYSADWLYIEKIEQDKKIESGKKFLKDNLVLVVSETGAKKVAGLDDLKKKGVVLVIADQSAPIGVYSKNAMISLKLWDKIYSNIKAMPSTVNQVAILIKENQADAGLVYSSVAKGNGLKQLLTIDEKDSGEIVFGYAVIKGGQKELSEAFANHTLKNIALFEKYGWKSYE